MPDRLAEIRARLDAAQTRIEHNAGWCDDSQHQRVVQMNDMREVCVVADTGERKFIAHAPADIAWLLDEVERYRADEAERGRISGELRRLLNEREDD